MRIEEEGRFDARKLEKWKSQKFGGHQGKETKRQFKKQLVENRLENVVAKKEKNPNKDRQQSVEIGDVLQRLISRDRKNTENPRLKNYLKWLGGKIEKIGDRDGFDVFAECRMDFERSSGPGGQKVNKTSSAVDLRHKYLGIRLFVQEKRDQVSNREIAGARMKNLVEEHVKIWEGILNKSTGDWEGAVVGKLKNEYEELLEKRRIGAEKKGEILELVSPSKKSPN